MRKERGTDWQISTGSAWSWLLSKRSFESSAQCPSLGSTSTSLQARPQHHQQSHNHARVNTMIAIHPTISASSTAIAIISTTVNCIIPEHLP